MRFLSIGALLCGTLAICQAAKDKKVVGYFPNWLYNNFPSSKIPFDKYTHINYAFALQNHDDGIPFFQDDWAIENYLPELVRSAHGAKTKVLLSIGGWTGSEKFSPMVASPELRKHFIDWNLDFIEKYNTDGVDIDWEYPGKQAAGCNTFDDKDTDNLLLLLKELRASLDAKFPKSHKEISMAVYVLPFLQNGEPSMDVSEFAPYFDHINIMAYDINGAWAPLTGPNAPFNAEQDKGANFSFANSIKAWKDAGVPSDKINAGLAFYGRSMQATKDMSFSQSQYQDAVVGAPKGDSDDAYWANPFCSADIDGMSGIWKWSNLRSQGLIKKNTLETGEGWTRHWDDQSKTPWLFNPASKMYISYDDPASLQIKLDHVACEGLGGVMAWDIHQDNGELIDVIDKMNWAAPSCSHKASVGDDDTPPTTSHVGHKAKPSHGSHASSSARVSVKSSKSAKSSAFASATKSAVASPSASSVKPNDKVLAHGAKCSTPGTSVCVAEGQSGDWVTCDITNVFVSRPCGLNLVCYNAQAGIYCGNPPVEAKAGKPSLAVESSAGEKQ